MWGVEWISRKISWVLLWIIFFLLILRVQMMLLLSMTMVTLWMKKVVDQITPRFIHSVDVSDCLAGTVLHTGIQQGLGQSLCSYILVVAGNEKGVNKTQTSNFRLWQVLEEYKTEGNDEVRGARMNSLVCVLREGLMEEMTLSWDLNDRQEPEPAMARSGRRRF